MRQRKKKDNQLNKENNIFAYTSVNSIVLDYSKHNRPLRKEKVKNNFFPKKVNIYS